MRKVLLKSIIASGVLALGICSFYNAYALYKRSAEPLNVNIAADISVKYYLKVFNGSSEVSSTELVINPSDDKEYFVSDISMNKGYKAKVTDSKGAWYGSTSSYTHNLSAAASTATGYVSNEGDYIAAQDDTYDFYLKFSDNTHKTYTSTHVNEDSVATVIFHDNWTKKDFSMHYWSDSSNLISPDWKNKPSMTYTDNVWKCVVPNKTEKIIIVYHDGRSTETTITGTSYNFTFSHWDGGQGKAVLKEWTA